jgi:hypothetical protein
MNPTHRVKIVLNKSCWVLFVTKNNKLLLFDFVTENLKILPYTLETLGQFDVCFLYQQALCVVRGDGLFRVINPFTGDLLFEDFTNIAMQIQKDPTKIRNFFIKADVEGDTVYWAYDQNFLIGKLPRSLDDLLSEDQAQTALNILKNLKTNVIDLLKKSASIDISKVLPNSISNLKKKKEN